MEPHANREGATTTSTSPAAVPRPVIQLPSFREVQAAQKPVQAPNLFQASRSGALGNVAGGMQPQGASSNTAYNGRPGGAAVQGTTPAPAAAHLPTSGVSSAASIPQARPPHISQALQQPVACISRPVNSSIQPAAAPQAPVHVQANPNAILVSHRQKGNPLLKHINNVRKEFADLVPDYLVGANACVLFLSLRYHLLKPEYIHFRIRELQRSFTLRILLCHVDVDDVVEPLQQVTRAAIANQLTLVCAWSDLECARYLETFKAYESKPADLIQGRADEDYLSRLNSAITSVRGINRTDVLTLGANFHTAAGIMRASRENLSLCPGIGPTKVRRLYDAFHEPFRKTLQPSVQEQSRTATSSCATEDQRTSAGTSALTPNIAPDLVVLDSDNEADNPDY